MYIRVQDIDEECVILEEIIDLETASIADPKISKKFAVVGCGGTDRMGFTYIHLITVSAYLNMWGQCVIHV